MFGIDVSHHNGSINWKDVSTNLPKVNFAYLKSSEGSSVIDNRFIINATGCIQNNIPFGAYHFATWNINNAISDAEDESKLFIKRLKMIPTPNLPAVLDVESNKEKIILSKPDVLIFIHKFFSEVNKAGFDTALYCSKGFVESFLPISHDLENVKLWLAQHNNLPKPKLPTGWNKYWIWQFSRTALIKGIKTVCDVNRSENIL